MSEVAGERFREFKVRNLVALAQLQEELAKKYGEEVRETVKTLTKKTFALSLFNIVDYITTIISLSDRYPEFKTLLPSRQEIEEIFREKECRLAGDPMEKGNSGNNNEQGLARQQLMKLNHLPAVQPPSQPTQSQSSQQKLPWIVGEREGWDSKVDYVSMYNALASMVMNEKGALYKSRCYAALALIILSNGLLSIEGVEAFKEALRNNASVVYVLERRRGGKKEPEPSFKEVKIPEIARSVFPICKRLLDISDQRIVNRFSEWLRKTYRVNPYSLRYSYFRHQHSIAKAPLQKT